MRDCGLEVTVLYGVLTDMSIVRVIVITGVLIVLEAAAWLYHWQVFGSSHYSSFASYGSVFGMYLKEPLSLAFLLAMLICMLSIKRHDEIIAEEIEDLSEKEASQRRRYNDLLGEIDEIRSKHQDELASFSVSLEESIQKEKESKEQQKLLRQQLDKQCAENFELSDSLNQALSSQAEYSEKCKILEERLHLQSGDEERLSKMLAEARAKLQSQIEENQIHLAKIARLEKQSASKKVKRTKPTLAEKKIPPIVVPIDEPAPASIEEESVQGWKSDSLLSEPAGQSPAEENQETTEETASDTAGAEVGEDFAVVSALPETSVSPGETSAEKAAVNISQQDSAALPPPPSIGENSKSTTKPDFPDKIATSTMKELGSRTLGTLRRLWK